jgi:DNA-binding XRE family transcriptional regulator
MDRITIGKRLAAIRAHRMMSQAELAAAINTSKSAVFHYEHGHAKELIIPAASQAAPSQRGPGGSPHQQEPPRPTHAAAPMKIATDLEPPKPVDETPPAPDAEPPPLNEEDLLEPGQTAPHAYRHHRHVGGTSAPGLAAIVKSLTVGGRSGAASDGHITCGRVECDKGAMRRKRADEWARTHPVFPRTDEK